MIKYALLPLSWLYGAVNRGRVWLYQSGLFTQEVLPGKVISIGNIEVGGTGKSPVVVAVCQALRAAGARPLILTRGYRSGLAADNSVVLKARDILLPPENGEPFQADEARMQAAQLVDVPVVVGRKRFAAAKRYLQHFPAPTHWILDDGFQHLQLARDFDLVLLDAAKPLDNGFCMPLGRLREFPQALRRAHAFLATRAEPAADLSEVQSLASALNRPLFRVRFTDGPAIQLAGPACDPSHVQHWTLALGIARPERIQRSLEKNFAPITQTYLRRDHEAFDFKHLKSIIPSGGALLTTEKDYWRAPESFAALGSAIFCIPLELDWQDSNTLSALIGLFMQSLQKQSG